jgi:hypothetical protein
LFQGRYKSLFVEEGEWLGNVCHYIHLNPVRAGAAAVEKLRDYRHGSYWYLWQPKRRPPYLRVQTALERAGGLADTRAGWKVYQQYLAWQAAEGPAGRNKAYASMSRGWALGTKGFRTSLAKDHALHASSRAWEVLGAKEIRETQCAELLSVALRKLGKTVQHAHSDRKSADWKFAIAAHFKQCSQASNHWLAEQLQMGSSVAVSRYVGDFRRNENHGARRMAKALIAKVKT